MVKLQLSLIAVLAFFSSLTTADYCRDCEIIMNLALYHFNNQITDQNALLSELQRDCSQQVQDVDHCLNMVQNNIQRIYRDLQNGMSPRNTCYDLGECDTPLSTTPRTTTWVPLSTTPRTTTWVPITTTTMRLTTTTSNMGVDIGNCRNCELILSIAVYHFDNNIQDKEQLKNQLLIECSQIASGEGPATVAHCQNMIYANIDRIFDDLRRGVVPYQTCMDIGECSYPNSVSWSSTYSSHAPEIKAIRLKPEQQKTKATWCRECEIMLSIAENHYTNGMIEETVLKQQMLKECNQYQNIDSVHHCTNLVNNDMSVIIGDLQKGMHSHEVCVDLSECTTRSLKTLLGRFGRHGKVNAAKKI